MHEHGRGATLHNLLNNACDIDGDEAHSRRPTTCSRRVTVTRRTGWPAGATSTGSSAAAGVANRGAHQRHRVVRNRAEHADSVRRRADIGANGAPSRDRLGLPAALINRRALSTIRWTPMPNLDGKGCRGDRRFRGIGGASPWRSGRRAPRSRHRPHCRVGCPASFPGPWPRPPRGGRPAGGGEWPSPSTMPTTERSHSSSTACATNKGRLDILVNNAFALPEDLTDPKPFWEKPLSNWGWSTSVCGPTFVAASARRPADGARPIGSHRRDPGYTGSPTPTVCCSACARRRSTGWPATWAVELQPHRVASLSLWQGLTYTERAQRNLARDPAMAAAAATNPAGGCSRSFPAG